MDASFKLSIIKLLESDTFYNVNTLGTQHTIRCPYCNDKYSRDHGHFSLRIDTEDDEPILYRCLKCPASGLLTRDIIEDIGLHLSEELSDKLKAFNRKAIKKNKYSNNDSKPYIVPVFSDNYQNKSKLLYINSRLGLDIDLVKAKDLKIILNLAEFIKFNEIKTIPGFNENYLELLSNNYIGFLSSNNNTITLRSIIDNKYLKRYVKILLDPKNISPNSFYNIPNQIDLLYTNDINIHIAEGIFDIISIFFNMNNEELKNNFYYATCGFSYATIVKYLIYNGINTGINLHIYADKDKSDKDHARIINRLDILPWINSITIHRNNIGGEKDYGVSKEKIEDTQFKIKI